MKDKTQNCTARLTIALTENEKRKLDALAKGEGRKTSAMVRWIISNYLARRSFDVHPDPIDTQRLRNIIEIAGIEEVEP